MGMREEIASINRQTQALAGIAEEIETEGAQAQELLDAAAESKDEPST